MSGDTTTSSFCTMGGMMNNYNDDMHKMYRRQLLGKQYNADLQVILPDDHNMHNDIGIESDTTSGGPLEPGIPHNQIHDHDDHNTSSNNNIHNTSSNNINHDNNMNNHQTDHSHHHNMSDMNMNSGGGTIMYMDGFHSALFHNQSPPPPCLNLFSSSWTLHTQTKFIFAMIFITLLGILVEACGVWRVKCLRKGRNIRRDMKLKRYQAWLDHQQQLESEASIPGQQLEFRRQSTTQRGVSDISDVSNNNNDMEPPQDVNITATNHCPSVIRRFVVPKRILNIFRTNDARKVAQRYDILAATLHASRAWLGYLLMLAVMSYAVEFLISAVFGMVLGRYYFVDSGDGSGAAQGMMAGVGVGGGIGGMGLGGGGLGPASNGPEQHMTLRMTNMQNNNNDATWGGNDPCCGLDDDDDDNNNNQLLTPLIGSNTGVTRRSSQQMDIP